MSWENNDSKKCHKVDKGSGKNISGSTKHTTIGLEEDSNYTITVTATNAAGSSVSVSVTAMTAEAGERQSDILCIYKHI